MLVVEDAYDQVTGDRFRHGTKLSAGVRTRPRANARSRGSSFRRSPAALVADMLKS